MASDTISCGRCRNVISKPEELPCDHVLCLRCIQEMVEHAGDRQNNLRCPECRNAFTIPLNSCIDQRGYIREKYSKYIRNVKEVDCNGEVKGMAILGDELFVISDRNPFTFKFRFTSGGMGNPVELRIPGLVEPKGIAANAKLSCLYLVDWTEAFCGHLLTYKYDSGDAGLERMVTRQFEGRPCGVAVSPSCDKLLVTCMHTIWKTGFIARYGLNGDEITRLDNIELPEILRPNHSVLTSTKKYIVSHGWRFYDDQGLTMYQEDDCGNISKRLKLFYGKKGGGKGDQDLDRPVSLALDEDGLILVVSRNNHRIELMTDNFGLIRHLVTQKDGIHYPNSVCQHKETGLMFVGQIRKVLAFKVRDIKPVPEMAQAQC